MFKEEKYHKIQKLMKNMSSYVNILTLDINHRKYNFKITFKEELQCGCYEYLNISNGIYMYHPYSDKVYMGLLSASVYQNIIDIIVIVI